MTNFIMEHGMPVAEQPLDSNEVGRAIIAQRAFIAAMITGNRNQLTLERPGPVHRMPSPTPAYFYEEGEK